MTITDETMLPPSLPPFDEMCALCLGNNQDIPPFGTRQDALDFIKPCSSCSLVTHKRCLLDWLRSLSAELAARPANTEQTQGTWNQGIQNNGRPTISYSASSQLGEWVHFSGTFMSLDVHVLTKHNLISSAPCPQCKSTIRFAIGDLSMIDSYNSVLTWVCNLFYGGSLALIISGAATGVFVTGYKTLGQCGMNIIDTIKPRSIILPNLNKNKLLWTQKLVQPILVLLGSQTKGNRVFESLTEYDYVPLLPIIMYKMRRLLILNLIFGYKSVTLLSVITELQVCLYFSTLGKNVLAKRIWYNSKSLCNDLLSGKISLSSLFYKSIFQGINWWDPNVMVASIIPARWAYDLFYRLVINRRYLEMVSSVQPQTIVNTLPPADSLKIETLHLESEQLGMQLEQKVKSGAKELNLKSPLFKTIHKLFCYLTDRRLYRLAIVKLLHWVHKSKACLRNDYSTSIVGRLIILSCVSTIVWPYLAGDIGSIIFRFLANTSYFASADMDKLQFLSNLLGMGVAALVKDAGNLILANYKARQLLSINIVTESHETSQTVLADSSLFPGAYTSFAI